MEYQKLKSLLTRDETYHFENQFNPGYPATVTRNPQDVYEDIMNGLSNFYYTNGMRDEFILDSHMHGRKLAIRQLRNTNKEIDAFMQALEDTFHPSDIDDIFIQLFNTADIRGAVHELVELEESKVYSNDAAIKALAIMNSLGTFYVDEAEDKLTIEFTSFDFQLSDAIRTLYQNQLNPKMIYIYSPAAKDSMSLYNLFAEYIQYFFYEEEDTAVVTMQTLLEGYKQSLTLAYRSQERYKDEDDKSFAIEQFLSQLLSGKHPSSNQAILQFVAAMNFIDRRHGSKLSTELFSVRRVSSFNEVTTTSEF